MPWWASQVRLRSVTGSRSLTSGVESLTRTAVLVALVSVAAGVVGVVPFVIAGYVFQQYVLVAVDLATSDPTFDEGVVVSLVGGVLAPGAVLAVWGLVVHRLVRECDARLWLWLIAASALVLPLAVFVAQKS